MIEGGIPAGSIIGLSGPPGVGKSILVLHFLLEGARKGQKCVYINLEEPRSNVDRMIEQFSFGAEFKQYETEGKIIVKCVTYPEYEKIYLDLLKKIKDDNTIQRLVVDSFNCFFSSVQNPSHLNTNAEINIRRMVNQAFSLIRKKNLTTLLILEANSSSSSDNSCFYYNIPYLVDGLISLDFISLGSIERRVFIPKMRWTSQHDSSKPFEITKNGIFVKEEK